MSRPKIIDQNTYFRIAASIYLAEVRNTPATIREIADVLHATEPNVSAKLVKMSGEPGAEYALFKKTDYIKEGKLTQGRKQTLLMNWSGWYEAFAKVFHEQMHEASPESNTELNEIVSDEIKVLLTNIIKWRFATIAQLMDEASTEHNTMNKFALTMHGLNASNITIRSFLASIIDILCFHSNELFLPTTAKKVEVRIDDDTFTMNLEQLQLFIAECMAAQRTEVKLAMVNTHSLMFRIKQ